MWITVPLRVFRVLEWQDGREVDLQWLTGKAFFSLYDRVYMEEVWMNPGAAFQGMLHRGGRSLGEGLRPNILADGYAGLQGRLQSC